MLTNAGTILMSQAATYLESAAVSDVRIRRILDVIQYSGSQYAIFGGVLRDLHLFGRGAKPRDIDLVLEDESIMEALPFELFDSFRKNRFGGLHIEVGKIHLDMWSIFNTWAFKHNYVPEHDFYHLALTSFLNIEAIVAVFKGNQSVAIYSAGFFEAMKSKRVDINLEENPFPDLCIVRALAISNHAQFLMSPRLVRYIAKHSERYSVDQLQKTQLKHYGKIILPKKYIQETIVKIRKHCLDSSIRAYKPLYLT